MTDETYTPSEADMADFEETIDAAAGHMIRELGPDEAYAEARYLVGQVVFARYLLTEKLGMSAEDSYDPIADTLIAINADEFEEGALSRTNVMFGYYVAERALTLLDQLGVRATKGADGFGMYL